MSFARKASAAAGWAADSRLRFALREVDDQPLGLTGAHDDAAFPCVEGGVLHAHRMASRTKRDAVERCGPHDLTVDADLAPRLDRDLEHPGRLGGGLGG